MRGCRNKKKGGLAMNYALEAEKIRATLYNEGKESAQRRR